MDDQLIPIAVFRPIVETWLQQFDSGEAGYQALASNSNAGADAWRFRLSDGYKRSKSRYGNTNTSRGWFTYEAIDWVDVDEFLTAADATYLWRSTGLADYLPAEDTGWPDSEHDNWCAECGTTVDFDRGDLGVRVELGQMVNVRRRWAWWTLCAICAAEKLPRTKSSGTTRIPDEMLLTLYRSYVREELGIDEIAAKVWRSFRFPAAHLCEAAIGQAWGRFGWPKRTRGQTKHLKKKHGRKVCHNVPEKDLRHLHVLHTRGKKLSIYELSRRLYGKYNYSTPEAMQRAVSDAWKTLGLKARDRIDMTREMSTKDGLSPRDAKLRRKLRSEAGRNVQTNKPLQPICVGTTQRGKRCASSSLPDSRYCWAHDPRFEDDRQAQTLAMRAKNPLQDPARLEPYEPLRLELERFLELVGTWKPLAQTSGLDAKTQISHMKTDRVRQNIDRLKAARMRRAIREAYELAGVDPDAAASEQVA